MKNADPLKVIGEALAKTLVFYYPFAGWLREGPDRKLTVDCTGEGVVFVAAEADVRAEEFPLYPPFLCMDQLLYDHGHLHGSQGILNSPLMFVQVTRLSCGGFILAIKFTHNMCDAFGMSQFLTAMGDIARGRTSPSVLPIWKRELLNVRNPPKATCTHYEFIQFATKSTTDPNPDSEMVYHSFFFNSTNISVLRNLVPTHLAKCSTFDLLAACIWLKSSIPVGYYGNAFVLPGVISTVKDLCENPIGYALELVMNAKANVTEEYLRSFIDITVMKGRAPISTEWTYIVDDLTQLGLWDTNYGWGKPIYGGMC
ncbi:Benzyl alcohol O-benzoyltransferase [Heracleum sosnowskyi]|uniref:Benzyl alcohol O-benzoyltransferase n=1 Tax=Heracleum sosnowskyi TaxID=360622 RepID=A0AAD8IKS4_9APIA|nr:Benzyl alcohol O-benzoyltransferase [Heracleum sosnowskyi]